MLERFLTDHPATRKMRIRGAVLTTAAAVATVGIVTGAEGIEDAAHGGANFVEGIFEWGREVAGGDAERDHQGMAPPEATLSLGGLANVSHEMVEAPLAVPVMPEV